MAELDQDQEAAVNSISENTIVIAGAGSGKTRVLVQTLARLIDDGCKESTIVLTTFTRKAAYQMQLRAEELTGRNLDGLVAGTIHSIAATTLQQKAGESTKVLDQEEAVSLLEELAGPILAERNEEELGGVNYSSLLERFSLLREGGGEETLPGGDRKEFIKELLEVYGKRKREEGWADYSDLLIHFNQWLSDKEGRAWAQSLRAVLVDEAQDLNYIQRSIIDQLTNHKPYRVLIGDPGQCIYSWRGATASAMERATEEEGAVLTALINNYRSVPSIVDLANAALPPGPLAKAMVAKRSGTNQQPILQINKSPDEEATIVCKWLEDQEGDWADCAVLARTHKQLSTVETELRSRGIPVEMLGRGQIDDWQRLLAAFVSLADDDRDRLAWRKVILAAGQDKATAGQAIDQILKAGNPLVEFARLSEDDNIANLTIMLEESQSSPELWRRLCYGPYGQIMAAMGQGDAALLLAENAAEGPDFLEASNEPQGLGVALGTVHAAKGLEWSSVAVIRLGRGGFPLGRAASEEEERLFYVAITRARDNLLLNKAGWLHGPCFTDRHEGLLRLGQEQL